MEITSFWKEKLEERIGQANLLREVKNEMLASGGKEFIEKEEQLANRYALLAEPLSSPEIKKFLRRLSIALSSDEIGCHIIPQVQESLDKWNRSFKSNLSGSINKNELIEELMSFYLKEKDFLSSDSRFIFRMVQDVILASFLKFSEKEGVSLEEGENILLSSGFDLDFIHFARECFEEQAKQKNQDPDSLLLSQLKQWGFKGESIEELGGEVLLLEEENWKEMISSGVTLVDFYTDQCKPCDLMGFLLEDVAREVKGKTVIAKLNGMKAPNITKSLRIDAFPTLVLFKNGKEIKRIVGLQDVELIKDFALSAE